MLYSVYMVWFRQGGGLNDDALHATIVIVPAVVMVCNLFTNGLDRFDQLRASHMTARRERRMPLSVFTFLLYATVQSRYALYRSIKEPQIDTMTFKEFKRRVEEGMVASLFSLQAQWKSLVSVTRSTDLARCEKAKGDSDSEDEEGADNGGSVRSDLDDTAKKKPHMLPPTMGDAWVRFDL